MKIGILTQPLHTNYGGLLQCWALQHVLLAMGHDAWVVRRVKNSHSFFFWARIRLRNVVCKLFGRPKLVWLSRKDEAAISQQTRPFIDRYITPRTELIYSTHALRNDFERQRYDAYIVGSDQVWRPRYSPCQPNYFLDFLPQDSRVKRIAYAASFGTEQWEFSSRLTSQCATLARRFNAVSVREANGVRLCGEHLGIQSVQALDPTLLLTPGEYERLVHEQDEPTSPGTLFCYLLDRNPGTKLFKQDLEHELGLTAFEIMPQAIGMRNPDAPLKDRIYPRVTQWLRAFMDAQCVLTDSFHGCAFAILFNRPFVVIGNQRRGQARFHSLLSTFGLEERLVLTEKADDITACMKRPIDWADVNLRLKEWRTYSMDFLRNALHADGK